MIGTDEEHHIVWAFEVWDIANIAFVEVRGIKQMFPGAPPLAITRPDEVVDVFMGVNFFCISPQGSGEPRSVRQGCHQLC